MSLALPGQAVLDNPVWAALTGPHRQLAEINGEAARYHPEVSPFCAVSGRPGPRPWRDLAELVGPGGRVLLTGDCGPPPSDWEMVEDLPGAQLLDVAVAAAPDPEAVRLGPADVPEMLDLVARTRPGPFLTRTVELGAYLGIRREGALVAMAGERMHLPGWTEISAVCTDPGYRGQGLGTRLVRAVAAGIRARGGHPFLHTAAENTPAIRLYESIGFLLRRNPPFWSLRTPGGQAERPRRQ